MILNAITEHKYGSFDFIRYSKNEQKSKFFISSVFQF